MIGHNPSTPGGEGFGKGITARVDRLDIVKKGLEYILLMDKSITYERAAETINLLVQMGIDVKGVILESDEGVLVSNRIQKIIPIIDEVKGIDSIPEGVMAAVEVAAPGKSIVTLSNPYGIASVFSLGSDETKLVIPVAKCLSGLRSAVVIKTPEGKVTERVIPSGKLYLKGKDNSVTVDIDSGADEIMKAVDMTYPLDDAEGESGTNIGGMIKGVKDRMAQLTNKSIENVFIRDILAVDTMVPVNVSGGLAGERSIEKAVAVAAMVKTDKLPMEQIAQALMEKTKVYVKIAGVEAVMAALGAFTTPGVALPMAVLDIGGGSTDAAILEEDGTIKSIHLAGAGELVTMLINKELGLDDRAIAEDIKKYPLGKVESLFSIRLENGEVIFYDEPLPPYLFGRVVVLKVGEMVPVMKDISLERIISTRKSIKEKIFVTNSIRALREVAPLNNIRNIPSVVLVGGSALDFEIPQMILKKLSNYRIVAGQGNIRRKEGPRNAVLRDL
jgi:diol dehydratase reactivase alpha subunit